MMIFLWILLGIGIGVVGVVLLLGWIVGSAIRGFLGW